MTSTTAPVALTEQHRQAQANVRARALRDFLILWPLWTGDQASFSRLVTATMPLIRVYQQMSATVAATYYQAFREAESVAGDPAVKLAAPVIPKQIAASLYVTGETMTRNALASGQSLQQARAAALTRVFGAIARHVLDGGRDTILQSVAADKHALGWARVTDGNPCSFCLTLASRGVVYKSKSSADFLAHDACGCVAMAVYDGTTIPGLATWKRIYNQAQNDAEASGELQHGENSSKARLNAVRRYLEANPIGG